MSEKAPSSPEQLRPNVEAPPSPAEREPQRHTPEQTDITAPDKLAEIQKSIEQHALSGSELSPDQSEQTTPSQNMVNRELKKLTFQRTLTRVRKQLKPSERLLSKTIHQPAIDKISELTGQTIARPSGLLGGGLFALLGSTFIFGLARHYGFEYNFLAFFILFLLGYLAGLLVELALKLFRH